MLKELTPGVGSGGKAAGGVDRYGRMAKRNKNFETVLSGIAVNKLNLSYVSFVHYFAEDKPIDCSGEE